MNNNNGIVISSISTYPVNWEVTNKLAYPVRLRWINYEGKCVNPGFVLQPGQPEKLQTFVAHLFLVTNENATDPKDSFVKVMSVMGNPTNID